MKKVLLTLLTVSIIGFDANSIFGDELDGEIVNNNIKIEPISTSHFSQDFFDNPTDTLNGMLCSPNKPTSFFNLKNGLYTVNLVKASYDWLYTNYYFYPNSNGVIFLDYDLHLLNLWPTKMQIGVYDIDTKKIVQTFIQLGISISSCLMITNLNTSHRYAIAFRTYDRSNVQNEMYDVSDKIDTNLGRNYNYSLDKVKDIDKQINEKLSLINSKFNYNDFIVEKTTNNDNTIYDYRYTINGIKTNIGYTVIEENGNINIIDNIAPFDLDLLKLKEASLNNLDKKFNPKVVVERALQKDIENYSNESREIYDEYKFYDVKEDKLYYIVEVKVTDIINTSSIMLYREEIK